MTDILETLEQAAKATSTVAQGVRAEQLASSTPCTDWDVKGLMSHMTGVCEYFAEVASGGSPSAPAPAESGTRDEAVQRLAAAAQRAARAWQRPGALDGTYQLTFAEVPAPMAAGINLVDMYVHGWDLAKATGQQLESTPALVDMVSTLSRQIVSPDLRQRGAFAAEVQPAAAASDLDRLAAFLGREP
jgi:uncharacterized protein (TIGR03086 family)